MRKLEDVLDQMQESLPEDDEGALEFGQLLKTVKSSVLYSSPELMDLRWKELSSLLNVYIGDPSELDSDGWQKKIVDIFMDKL